MPSKDVVRNTRSTKKNHPEHMYRNGVDYNACQITERTCTHTQYIRYPKHLIHKEADRPTYQVGTMYATHTQSCLALSDVNIFGYYQRQPKAYVESLPKWVYFPKYDQYCSKYVTFKMGNSLTFAILT